MPKIRAPSLSPPRPAPYFVPYAFGDDEPEPSDAAPTAAAPAKPRRVQARGPPPGKGGRRRTVPRDAKHAAALAKKREKRNAVVEAKRQALAAQNMSTNDALTAEQKAKKAAITKKWREENPDWETKHTNEAGLTPLEMKKAYNINTDTEGRLAIHYLDVWILKKQNFRCTKCKGKIRNLLYHRNHAWGAKAGHAADFFLRHQHRKGMIEYTKYEILHPICHAEVTKEQWATGEIGKGKKFGNM